MGNREVDLTVRSIPGPALRATRENAVAGLSRRQLMRRAVGAGTGLWLAEMTAGTLGFLWSAAAHAQPRVRIGTYESLIAINDAMPVAAGFPAYVAEARAFIVVVDPARHGWTPGRDEHGEGTALNVRAMSQRCPHLGCRPNPCLEDFWFHCPCHESRYDRLGIKAAGELYGPAPRGLDRFATEVDASGVLFVDTSRITLGPLPVALGQPGLIPPLVANGCI
ncbi:MAG: Rieske 2Fe-2S domain-containing protein [Chloroflexota bacterium]